MAKKYTAIAILGLAVPFGTAESFDSVVGKYKTARLGATEGLEIINEALERTFIPKDGLDRIVAIWEFHQEGQGQQQGQSKQAMTPLDMRRLQ
jgi:hypothetical protein